MHPIQKFVFDVSGDLRHEILEAQRLMHCETAQQVTQQMDGIVTDMEQLTERYRNMVRQIKESLYPVER